MFDYLIERNYLDEEMKDCGLGEDDKKFIKAMIRGLKPGTVAVSNFH